MAAERGAVAAAARAAMAGGDREAAQAAWARLVWAEPQEPVWRLRFAQTDPEPAVALETCMVDALAADRPLAALAAALRAGLEALPTWFADYLHGSARLGRERPPMPPLRTPVPASPPPDGALPPWPAPAGDRLTPVPLVSALDAEGLTAVAPALSALSLGPGELLLAEGGPAQAVYVLVGGTLEVFKAHPSRGEVSLGRLRAGSLVGEMALVLDRPRTATVRAATEAELIRVELPTLRAASLGRPAVDEALRRFTRDRVLATLVGTSPLFADLDPESRGAVLWRFASQDVAVGELVIREGQDPAALCLVVEGEVEVRRADGEGSVRVARLGPGEVFGEIGLVRGGHTSASVVATRPTELLRLGREDFEHLCQQQPAIRHRAAALAAARVAENRFIFDDAAFIEAAD